MTVMIDELLTLLGDMESFSEIGDALSCLVEREASRELSENDLTFVSAASRPPSFSDFFRRYCK